MADLPSLWIAEDNKIVVDSLKDSESDTYVNDATGTFHLLDNAGATLTGTSGTMSYQAASNGRYIGYLESTQCTTTTVTEYGTYYIEIALSSSSADLYRRVPVTARYHGR